VSYIKKASATTYTTWDNSDCTNPINIDGVQNVASDKNFYVEFSQSVRSVAAGWSTFDPTTGAISAFDFNENRSWVDSIDGGVHALTAGKLNSTINGRYVFGQRGGQTVSDSGSFGGLANTGGNYSILLIAALVGIIGGLVLLVRTRKVEN
jgi:hypothetical protein